MWRALEKVFIEHNRLPRYDAHALDALRDRFLAKTNDPWERMDILRAHAKMAFGAAVSHGRGLRELTRLFEAQRRLGFSDDLDEWLSIGLYARVLVDHGKRVATRRLLEKLTQRLAKRYGILGYIRKTLAKDMREFR